MLKMSRNLPLPVGKGGLMRSYWALQLVLKYGVFCVWLHLFALSCFVFREIHTSMIITINCLMFMAFISNILKFSF